MHFSRRKFVAGLSAAGAMVPAAYYGHREYQRRYGEVVTPGEAVAAPAGIEGRLLAQRLRGIWDLRLLDQSAPLPGFPSQGMELVLDVGLTGRAVRGYAGAADVLRGEAVPPYRVSGSLQVEAGDKVRWLLLGNDPEHEGLRYACDMVLDEAWGKWGNAGSATLSGEIGGFSETNQSAEQRCAFMAIKRPFPEARETASLAPALIAWLASAEHRLFHQLWHASRDKWHRLSEDKRQALRALGWQPGPRDSERDARGKRKHRNGSGEDFFFMHRHMLSGARLLQPDLKCWARLPLPSPFIEHDRVGFIRYHENQDGASVAPGWEAEGDLEYTQWLQEVKGSETFFSNYQVWESQYQDPQYLSRLTLGEFGSEMELGIHDWMHIRWATVGRDPNNDGPLFWDREYTDFSPRWFQPQNDYLGEPFSSHVNPVFWMFHGWIDARIEDWFQAHERVHPGEVQRLTVKGIPWFAPGPWVSVADPWLGASPYGCLPPGQTAHDDRVTLDVDVMKLALRIAFSGDDDVPDLLRRVPRRPWYAENLMTHIHAAHSRDAAHE